MENLSKDKIQTEVLRVVKPHPRCGVNLGMGVGKTYLAIKHMLERYTDTVLFLYVIPNNDRIKGFKDELKKHNLEFLVEHIIFVTYLSLNKKVPKDFDYVYFDEAHKLRIKHNLFLSNYSGHMFGFTGTWPDDKSEAGQLLKKYMPLVYTYKTTTAIDDNLLNDYKIYVHELELDNKNTYRTKFAMTSELKDYQMWSRKLDKADPYEVKHLRIMRMKSMQKYNTKVEYAKKLLEYQQVKALVFTDYTEQADYICKHSFHSKNKLSKANLEMFKSGEITKLSSVNQLAEGENVEDLIVGIVLHSYANQEKLAQKIGRFLRLNTKEKSIIHVMYYKNTVDEKWLKSALKNFHQSKIFKFQWPSYT